MQYSLKELRARKRKTQAQVARDLGITTATYNYWENNVNSISVNKAVKLANYYGVTIDQIFLDLT